MPRRGSETFISTIGHLDGRIDLYNTKSFVEGTATDDFTSGQGTSTIQVEMGNRVLMDLCIMASKLAYENANVVRNVVVHHWKACYFPLTCFFYLY